MAVYIFHIRTLRNTYPFSVKHQMHTDKICFILY